METERLKNSTLNVSSNVIIYVAQTILSFIVRTFFIKVFGEKLLGLDSLMINVLAMLSIAELGISSAISYSLYKPLVDKDKKKINAFMSFYRRVYSIIGLVVIVIGIILSFFLKNIVGNYNYSYLYVVYFIYLLDTASLYFISYKEILLIADQKNYKEFRINFIFKLVLYLLQLVVIIFYPNYIAYLLVMLFSKFGNRLVVNRYISKYYSDIDFHSKNKLSKNDIDVVKKNVYGIFCFKVGDYVINCSDNIIISSMINLVVVGIYTNYLSITTILKTIIRNIFNGVTASFGNLSVEGNKKAEKNVFNIMVFIGFVVSGYVTICFLNLINPFIKVWLGKKYVLPYISMVIICINFYLMCNQIPLDTIKEAYGFYNKDRYIPLIQAFINILFSILLAYYIGFNGVILGTAISYLTTVFWNKPYMIFKYIFKESPLKYYLNCIFSCMVLVVIYLVDFYVLSKLNLSINLVNLIISGIIVSIIYVAIISIVYFNKREFRFCLNSAKKILLKK